MTPIYFYFKLYLGVAFGEHGWEDTPPKCGITMRRPPFGRSGTYAGRDLGDAARDALTPAYLSSLGVHSQSQIGVLMKMVCTCCCQYQNLQCINPFMMLITLQVSIKALTARCHWYSPIVISVGYADGCRWRNMALG
jgi:hypothetical protein